MEESKQTPKRSKIFRKIRGASSIRFFLRNLRRRRTEEPWARIHERKGTKTLVWGMGDGKTFGSVPLDPEVAFSVDATGVRLQSGNGDPFLIGSSGNETTNVLLSREIEKLFRKLGMSPWIFWIVWVAGSVVLLSGIVSMVVSGISSLGHLASLSQDLSGNGGENLPPLSDLPSSMSSGLTCRTH
ncbi:MAG: hypothetical protein ACYCYP_03115 [Leptospirales bacterium]